MGRYRSWIVKGGGGKEADTQSLTISTMRYDVLMASVWVRLALHPARSTHSCRLPGPCRTRRVCTIYILRLLCRRWVILLQMSVSVFGVALKRKGVVGLLPERPVVRYLVGLDDCDFANPQLRTIV